MIECPPEGDYKISHLQIWEILIAAEMMGGNRIYNHKINKILEVLERYD